MFKLRSYQEEAVQATLKHFRVSKDPAVIVLPTGAGKSLVIAELARLALGRVLVLAHVKELVEQNHLKFSSFQISSGIYSAGLNQKDFSQKVIFGSIQSIARAEEEFFIDYSLLVIDECHRVSTFEDTQYLTVINKLQKANPELCILGLTATPYRLGLGWIYQYNSYLKVLKTDQERFFKKCIYELSISYLIKNKFLTIPVQIDSPVACYDFSSLKLNGTSFVQSQIESILKDQKRITPVIVKNIIDMSVDRKGVMIFTTSINHAIEIMKNLPPYISALVVGETPTSDRDEIIEAFKAQKLKFLVNVSVLTTGFDAPHVDVIAILRPTESVSLYQQIVGRGLRLFPEKTDCLILDYTGQGHNVYAPDIEDKKPHSVAVMVEITCPSCGTLNSFWGIKDNEGNITEHYGRKCQGAFETQSESKLDLVIEKCGFRFRFKNCDQCGAENDISARNCNQCEHTLVDEDKKLKEAMSLKDAHVMKVETMLFKKGYSKKMEERLEVSYYDVDAQELKEFYYFSKPEQAAIFYFNFIRMHNKRPEQKIIIQNVDEAIKQCERFRIPIFVIARKQKHFWAVREKIF